MKLVKEILYEKFVENSDPIADLGIGIKHEIQKWLNNFELSHGKDLYIQKPSISDDGYINANKVDISWPEMNKLPEYIKFGEIKGEFSCCFGKKELLYQLPKKVGNILGIFPVNHNTNKLDYTEKDVLKYCEVDINNIYRYINSGLSIGPSFILVNKNVNEKFTQDSDPIKDLGIGIDKLRTFDTEKELTKWVLDHMTHILRVKEIPNDIIIGNDGYFLKKEYTDRIIHYATTYFRMKDERYNLDRVPNWKSLFKAFAKRGYKTHTILEE